MKHIFYLDNLGMIFNYFISQMTNELSKNQNKQKFKIPETGPRYPMSEHPPHLSDEVLE